MEANHLIECRDVTLGYEGQSVLAICIIRSSFIFF